MLLFILFPHFLTMLLSPGDTQFGTGTCDLAAAGHWHAIYNPAAAVAVADCLSHAQQEHHDDSWPATGPDGADPQSGGRHAATATTAAAGCPDAAADAEARAHGRWPDAVSANPDRQWAHYHCCPLLAHAQLSTANQRPAAATSSHVSECKLLNFIDQRII
jgi:hypothetical protein